MADATSAQTNLQQLNASASAALFKHHRHGRLLPTPSALCSPAYHPCTARHPPCTATHHSCTLTKGTTHHHQGRHAARLVHAPPQTVQQRHQQRRRGGGNALRGCTCRGAHLWRPVNQQATQQAAHQGVGGACISSIQRSGRRGRYTGCSRPHSRQHARVLEGPAFHASKEAEGEVGIRAAAGHTAGSTPGCWSRLHLKKRKARSVSGLQQATQQAAHQAVGAACI
eukprot:1161141-Pelagomonas_calceolata.AAC.1